MVMPRAFVCGGGMFQCFTGTEHDILRIARTAAAVASLGGLNHGRPDTFDFSIRTECRKGLPVDELAELRKVAATWVVCQAIGKGGFNDGGYWVVTRTDVKEVSGATTSTCPR